MSRIDVHQHLWPEGFIEALRKRRHPPRLHAGLLELGSDPGWEIDLDVHRLDRRLDLLDRVGLELALVSLQPTLGLERLPDDERAALAEVWEDGMLELARAAGGRIEPLAVNGPRAGFVGLCVAAVELLDLPRLAPRLDALAASGGFLFVHPSTAPVPAGKPAWWPGIVDYTAQMQAAYAAWLLGGAGPWPGLEVVFAILAGGAPFQMERLASRGVEERTSMRPRVWFDIASYGPRALDFTMSAFGVERMLFGSDTPVVDPAHALRAVESFGRAVSDSILSTNPRRLLGR